MSCDTQSAAASGHCDIMWISRGDEGFSPCEEGAEEGEG
jgi:hypothetical protein